MRGPGREMRRVWIGLGLGLAITALLAVVLSAIFSPPEAARTPTQVADYPFALREPVAFAVDFTSQHGVCNNRYASGEVVDMAGQPVDGLQILIRVGAPPLPSGQSLGAVTGADSVVGAGRWHVSLMRLGDPETNTVELHDAAGNLLAVPVPFSFDMNCAENMAVVNFVQVRAE